MKYGWIMGVVLALSLPVLSLAQQKSYPGFAVVELFTSEGCSSCPPANDLLNLLTAEVRQSHQPVYTLSFEVDYWDNLGWKGAFSAPQYTQRQQDYAQRLSGGVYTPEMIINGREGFIGSDEDKARLGINTYLNQSASNALTMTLEHSGSLLKVHYQLAHESPDSVINVVLVERGLQSQVTAGENGGRRIRHDNLVRQLKTVELEDIDTQGDIELGYPKEGDLKNYSVIAYVQLIRDMSITAATGADLGNALSSHP